MSDLISDLEQHAGRCHAVLENARPSAEKSREKSGGIRRSKDRGNRAAVTGGKHLDGFLELIAEILEEAGFSMLIYWQKRTELPGSFSLREAMGFADCCR